MSASQAAATQSDSSAAAPRPERVQAGEGPGLGPDQPGGDPEPERGLRGARRGARRSPTPRPRRASPRSCPGRCGTATSRSRASAAGAIAAATGPASRCASAATPPSASRPPARAATSHSCGRDAAEQREDRREDDGERLPRGPAGGVEPEPRDLAPPDDPGPRVERDRPRRAAARARRRPARRRPRRPAAGSAHAMLVISSRKVISRTRTTTAASPRISPHLGGAAPRGHGAPARARAAVALRVARRAGGSSSSSRAGGVVGRWWPRPEVGDPLAELLQLLLERGRPLLLRRASLARGRPARVGLRLDGGGRGGGAVAVGSGAASSAAARRSPRSACAAVGRAAAAAAVGLGGRDGRGLAASGTVSVDGVVGRRGRRLVASRPRRRSAARHGCALVPAAQPAARARLRGLGPHARRARPAWRLRVCSASSAAAAKPSRSASISSCQWARSCLVLGLRRSSSPARPARSAASPRVRRRGLRRRRGPRARRPRPRCAAAPSVGWSGTGCALELLARGHQLALAPGELGPQAVDLGAQRAGLEPQLLRDRRLLLRLGDGVPAAAPALAVGQRQLDDDVAAELQLGADDLGRDRPAS